jgi:RNA polymerase sigma factor (sigma-70 family)
MLINPLRDAGATDVDDAALVAEARAGSQAALEELVLRHQRWIYNIVRRMAYNPVDAEDATQEILIKVITKLSTFEALSSFRTWLYRIVVNHVLNKTRSRSEASGWTFDRYHRALQDIPDAEVPEDRTTPADRQVLVEEAKISITSRKTSADWSTRTTHAGARKRPMASSRPAT